jgi:hypothetical protein
MRHLLPAAALVTLLSFAPVRAATTANVTLIVHIENYAGARFTDLARAANEASRIYGDVGVRLRWLDPGESVRPDSVRGPAIDAIVLLLDQERAQRMIDEEHRADNVLGRAVPEAWRAYIFYDRVMNASAAHNRDRGLVLGKVVAHEMGHLFLGHHHAPTGLMRSELDLHSNVGFTSEQGALIRQTIDAGVSDPHSLPLDLPAPEITR